MAKVPSSLSPGQSAPSSGAKPSGAKAAAGKSAQAARGAGSPARVVKANASSLKALRAFRREIGTFNPNASKASEQAGTEESQLHPDVMSGEFDQAQLEKALNQGWSPKEGVEAKEEKEEREQLAKANEQEKAAKEGHAPGSGGTGKQAAAKAGPSSGSLPKAGQSDFNQGQQKVGGSGVHAKLSAPDPTHAEQVKAAHAAEAATAHKAASGKPLDAFGLLNQAKDKGYYFKEDQHGAGHPEDLDDPELAAAVEETIRMLFGVRGIMRVAPGRNEANEPVVVVVAAHGFSDASLSKVPPKVSKFDTLLAVSYEFLPIRRER